jgi:hypothetical protein
MILRMGFRERQNRHQRRHCLAGRCRTIFKLDHAKAADYAFGSNPPYGLRASIAMWARVLKEDIQSELGLTASGVMAKLRGHADERS